MDPAGRMTCDELLDHSYFDHFRDWFKPELDMLLTKDARKIAKSKSRMHVCVLYSLLMIIISMWSIHKQHVLSQYTTPHHTHNVIHVYIYTHVHVHTHTDRVVEIVAVEVV